jgi:hypothetical protein
LGTISDFTAQLKGAEYPLENKLSMALLIPVISQYVTAPLHIHACGYLCGDRWRPAAERVRKVVEEYNKISLPERCVSCQPLRIDPYSNNR